GRTVTTYSTTTVLTGLEHLVRRPIGLILRATREYGDFRVRGIDVFQTVQPNNGARMFGFPDAAGVSPPFPLSCGGGTPPEFPVNCGSFTPADPPRTGYRGVALDARKRTTAVAYVDMANTAASDGAQALDVILRARVGGRLLSGAITQQRV